MTKKEYHKILSCFYDRHHIINNIRPKYVNNPVALDFIDNYILKNDFYDIDLYNKFGFDFYYGYNKSDWIFQYNQYNNSFYIDFDNTLKNQIIKHNNLNDLTSDIIRDIFNDNTIKIYYIY